MTTWLQRNKNTRFERKVRGVRLVQAVIAENVAPSVAVGGTMHLEPRMVDGGGFPIPSYTASTHAYESSDEAKATIHATNGLVTAVYTGSTDTTIVATVTSTTPGAQEFEDTVTVTITGDTTPASVDVTPPTTTRAALATQQLTTVVKNAGGSTIAGETVTYASSDITKATVNASGLITAVATGSATITATSVTNPTLTDTCVVTVS